MKNHKHKALIILLILIYFLFQSHVLSAVSQTDIHSDLILGVTMHPLHHDPLNDPYDETRILVMLNNAKNIGAAVVGIDIHWNWIEDVSGSEWNPTITQWLEFVLKEASKRNLKVLAIVLETPCWASSDPDKDCSSIPTYKYNSAYPPSNPQDYANFIEKLIKKYKNEIQYWQIWNEPNEVSFFIDPDSTAYTALLHAAYPVIKEHDPKAIVLGGALSPRDHSQDANVNALDFLNNMYAAGAKGYFDAFAFHPYTDGFSPNYYNPGWPMSSFYHSVPTIREHMLAHGDISPIWITESGWTTVESCSNCDWQPQLPTTEEEQAMYLNEVFEIIKTWDYLDGYLYYTLTDKRNTDPTLWEDHFGLFRSDLTPKPAAYAFRDRVFVFDIYLPLIHRD
jgi:polysaccharide biosynthesis protein PslG